MVGVSRSAGRLERRPAGGAGGSAGEGAPVSWPARRRVTLVREFRMRAAIIAALAATVGLTGPALALDKVTFGTNWLADPEAGGYYQALVDGTYEKYGLDVTILQGGPTSNGGMLLIAGKIEFFMGGDMIGDFLSVQNNIPLIAVAADFQKNPQCIMAHPAVGLDKWQDLPNATPAFMSAGAVNTFWAWMRLAYGFKDENIKPYNFNSAPFIVDTHSIQQGYITSEPYEVEKQGHFKPAVFLLADYGYTTYSTEIITRREIVDQKPDLVQRFVSASAIGWYHYLYGDNAKANALIKKENPEMTDEQIDFSIAKIKEYGIVDSGDTLTKGIGAMTDEHWSDFYQKMVKAGIVKDGIDYKKAYTLQFVNKGVGLDLRPKN
jgi:NitT/TauT family transport system substrate-binding protein